MLGQNLQERTNILAPNTNDTLSFEEINAEYLAQASFLHMTSFVGDLPFEAQKRIAQSLPPSVSITFIELTLHFQINSRRCFLSSKEPECFFLTDKEVLLLTKKRFLEEGVKTLLDYGPEDSVGKMGKRGARIYSRLNERKLYVPP